MRRIIAPLLVAGLLALPATAAHADDPTYECGMDVVQNDTLTGTDYTGVAWGYAVHAGTTPVGIRCVVTVNGDDVDETEFHADNPGHGVTYGPVGFFARDSDVVELCAEVTTATARNGTAARRRPRSSRRRRSSTWCARSPASSASWASTSSAW